MNSTDIKELDKKYYMDDFIEGHNSVIDGDHQEMADKINKVNSYIAESEVLNDNRYGSLLFNEKAIFQLDIPDFNPSDPNDRGAYRIDIILNMIQAIHQYNIFLGLEKDLPPTASAPTSRALKLFIINEGYDVISTTIIKLTEIARSLLENKIEIYRNSFLTLILSATGVIFSISVFWIIIMYLNRRSIADKLRIYSYLTIKSIYFEINRISVLDQILDQNLSKSSMTMNLAVNSLSSLLPSNFTGFLSTKTINVTSSTSLKSVKKNNEHILIQTGSNGYLAQSSRFKYGKYIGLFWWQLFSIFSLILFWGIEIIILTNINTIVSTSSTINRLAMENTEYGMALHHNFARYYRATSPYIGVFYDTSKIRKDLEDIKFVEKAQSYVKWWSNNQPNLKNILGNINSFENFQKENI
jgi:hypothetical protein